MKTISILALGLALLCTSSAFAKTGAKHAAPAQTHHCQLNGAEAQKTKKACLKAGGTWEKGAPAGAEAKPAAAPDAK